MDISPSCVWQVRNILEDKSFYFIKKSLAMYQPAVTIYIYLVRMLKHTRVWTSIEVLQISAMHARQWQIAFNNNNNVTNLF